VRTKRLKNTPGLWISKTKSFFLVLLLVLSLIPIGCGGGGSAGPGGPTGNPAPATTPAGTITMAWSPPTVNTDGSSVTDLAGYVIYYGSTSGTYDHSIDVGNVTTYTLTGLTPGQIYYVAATSYNTSDKQSGYTDELTDIGE
jgi:hypothetical protein